MSWVVRRYPDTCRERSHHLRFLLSFFNPTCAVKLYEKERNKVNRH
ncbi:MAG: hypothetical protein NZ805_03280 [Armatimonadetes bacterium]|nr:hypothetical protein [Armatimonadota bacterium]MDW8027349.1 hypothetical protein [Armatimonadota bacterium]